MSSSIREKIKKIQKEWCKKCEKEHGQRDVDECFKCPFHILFNEIYEELSK